MNHVSQIETARQIVEIVPTVMQIVAAELRKAETPLVPTQLGVLTMLANEPCNLSSLAEHHAVSLPTMSNLISKMVEQGWVQRTRAEHDRRMVLIEISSEGTEVLQEIAHLVVGSLLKLLAPLSDKDRNDLVAGLAVLRRAFAVVPQPFPIEFQD